MIRSDWQSDEWYGKIADIFQVKLDLEATSECGHGFITEPTTEHLQTLVSDLCSLIDRTPAERTVNEQAQIQQFYANMIREQREREQKEQVQPNQEMFDWDQHLEEHRNLEILDQDDDWFERNPAYVPTDSDDAYLDASDFQIDSSWWNDGYDSDQPGNSNSDFDEPAYQDNTDSNWAQLDYSAPGVKSIPELDLTSAVHLLRDDLAIASTPSQWQKPVRDFIDYLKLIPPQSPDAGRRDDMMSCLSAYGWFSDSGEENRYPDQRDVDKLREVLARI